MKFFPWVLAATGMLAACMDTGPNFNIPVTIDEMESPNNYSNRDAGPVALRRLTRAQFKNSIRYLLGDEVVIPKLSDPDSNEGGLLSVGASITTFSPRGVESLETVAYSIAAQAVEVGSLQEYLSCTPGGVVDQGCSQSFIENFGRLAWRRPLNADEISALTQIAGDAAETLNDFNRGIEFATAAILQSPYFLFRVEIGEEIAGSTERQFSPLELASRLSFFLWNSTPDAELLHAAETGSLATREGLFAQASRLLEAPQAREGIRNFFTEQYELYELDHYSKDPTIFEHFQRELGTDAREETLGLLERIVFDDNSDFRDVMTTDHSYINHRLAALYGVPAPLEDGFGYVKLPNWSKRIGILGHASFLGLHSRAVASSATLRGKAIRNILLCQSIPVPPVDVDTSIPEPSGTTLTLRDRVAEHLENPSCNGCHQMTDPIGLGLENFDGIGRWRKKDHGKVIDASGDLDGEYFADMKGLAESIRNHPAFAPCVVKTLSRYATGRIPTREESAWLETLSDRFEYHGFRIKRVVMEIVMSPLFQKAGALKEVEEQS